MKLVFDKKGLVKDAKYDNVIIIPTSKREKEFFNTVKDERGNYKPWVYNALYKFGDIILDNPIDEDKYMELVDDYKFDNTCWDYYKYKSTNGPFNFLVKPSNFCILSYYCYLYDKSGKNRRLRTLYEKMIKLYNNQSTVDHFDKEGVNNAIEKQ